MQFSLIQLTQHYHYWSSIMVSSTNTKRQISFFPKTSHQHPINIFSFRNSLLHSNHLIETYPIQLQYFILLEPVIALGVSP